MRTIDIAPTIAYILRVPEPQQSQGVVRLDLVKGGRSRTLVPLIGLNDFHGQLEPTTMPMDGLNVSVGGAAQLATMFDEEAAQFPNGSLLLAAGDNVGASPANSGLLEDMPAIDVENAWGLDATSYGNHEFDYGVARLQAHQARADFPFLGANIVDSATMENPDWVEGTHVFQYGRHPDRRDRHRARDHARASQRRRHRGPHVPARDRDDPDGVREAPAAGRQGPGRADPRGHRRRDEHDRRRCPRCRGRARSSTIAEGIQDSTVDVIVAGHTHRVSNLMVGDILVAEGINAGASYSVVQMVVKG